MIYFAPAKINIYLQIINKRTDGFHDLESIFYPIWGLSDLIEILPASTTNFKLTGFPVPGKIEENLIFKTYQILKKKYNLPEIYLHLQKNIPLGAGLGGGSSDAATLILALEKTFNLQISSEEKEKLASDLGSDCPFFLDPKPSHISGKGEIRKEIDLDLSNYFIYLIYPDFPISTAEAFSKLQMLEKPFSLINFWDQPSKWKENFYNDFEKNAFEKYPKLSQIKEKLYQHGALYASMSGTGSTIFGIFEKEPSLCFSPYFERILPLKKEP